MLQNHQLSTWETFTRDLQLRFGPSSYANHQAELFKLKQLGSIAEYQSHFERLCNKVVGHAIGLTKLVESKNVGTFNYISNART
ncbi:hypothetical protein Lal_00000695 [Lupinus albus]|nr:hypothetical protein Lal_00000695 [Lupinus albus]